MNDGRARRRIPTVGLLLTALFWLLAVPSPSGAARLESGQIFVVGTGPAVFCWVSNLGAKPLTVLGTRLFKLDGTAVTTSGACVAAALQPGASCEFEGTDAMAVIPVRAEVEVKGSVKSVRARCVAVANGVVSDSAELR